jgi:hypothetical protein
MAEVALKILKDAPKALPAKAKRQRKSKAAPVVETKFKTINPAKMFIVGVTLFTLAVSLTHLSTGIIELTGSPVWQGVALALGIDALMVSVEFAVLTANADTKKEIHLAANAAMALALAWSGYLNAVGFSGNHLDADHAVQIGLGCSIPIFIWLESYLLGKLK